MVHDVGVWLFARTDPVVLMLRVQVSSQNISQHLPLHSVFFTSYTFSLVFMAMAVSMNMVM
jgi:hypothetical protein